MTWSSSLYKRSTDRDTVVQGLLDTYNLLSGDTWCTPPETSYSVRPCCFTLSSFVGSVRRFCSPSSSSPRGRTHLVNPSMISELSHLTHTSVTKGPYKRHSRMKVIWDRVGYSLRKNASVSLVEPVIVLSRRVEPTRTFGFERVEE